MNDSHLHDGYKNCSFTNNGAYLDNVLLFVTKLNEYRAQVYTCSIRGYSMSASLTRAANAGVFPPELGF